MESKKVMDAERMALAIKRMAQDIVRLRGDELDRVVVIGIHTRGIFIGNRIVQEIARISDRKVASGFLDPVLFRDDLTNMWPRPLPTPSKVPAISGQHVFLVDDVLDQGRTVLAAINNLHTGFGRPASIAIAVLVERVLMNAVDNGHRREIPFVADVIGKRITVSSEEWVRVRCTEKDGEDGVYLVGKEGEIG